MIENGVDVLCRRTKDKYTMKRREKKMKRDESFSIEGFWINKMVNESSFGNDERMVLYPNYLLSNNIEDPRMLKQQINQNFDAISRNLHIS